MGNPGNFHLAIVSLHALGSYRIVVSLFREGFDRCDEALGSEVASKDLVVLCFKPMFFFLGMCCTFFNEAKYISGWWQLKHFWNFHPEYWGRFQPILTFAYFSNGWEKTTN